MTVKECYEKMGADYEDVKERMMTDKMIYKYNKKFLEMREVTLLQQNLQKADYEEAFRMAHSIKGMCLNLGYASLFEASSALCEELRGGAPTSDLGPLLKAVTENYEKVIGCIGEMDECR